MTDLEKRLMGYLNSDDGKKAMQTAAKKSGGKDFKPLQMLDDSVASKRIAEDMKVQADEILRKYVRNGKLRSEGNGAYFLSHITSKVYYDSAESAWIIELEFTRKYNDDGVLRRNFAAMKYRGQRKKRGNPKTINMAALVNNQWVSDPYGKTWGYDRWGNKSGASNIYMNGDFKGFVAKAAKDMQKAFAKYNVKVEYSKLFDGGTLNEI